VSGVNRADNHEFVNVLQHEVKRGIKAGIQDESKLRNNSKSVQNEEMVNQIVFYRKFCHPERIFNDSIQRQELSREKHFDFNNFRQKWHVRFSDEECYVCNKYQFVNFFFRSSRAQYEFVPVTDEKEDRAIRSAHNVDALQ